jgi:FtsP/CotA-like multicopper oxidase with cupredoxin domain
MIVAVDRREFLKGSGLALLAASGAAGVVPAAACSRPAPPAPPNGKPDYTLRIGTGTVELAPDQIVSTLTYNGQFPGPLVRFKEGQRAWVDIFNDTDTPEQLHWHGLQVGVDVDGAAEEGTPYIPPTACGAFPLSPARRASASITRTWSRAPTCRAVSTAGWSARFISNPNKTPAPMTKRSS